MFNYFDTQCSLRRVSLKVMANSASIFWGPMDLIECLLLFLKKNCFPADILPDQTLSSLLFTIYVPFLPAGSAPTYNMCLRRMTVPIPQTNVLYLYFSKAFETILNWRVLRHLSDFSDRRYGFRKRRCTGDPLFSFLTHLWSSSLSHFGETFYCCLRHLESFWQFGTNLALQTTLLRFISLSLHLYLQFPF